MNWITPKTDWTSTDRFNIEDFNRIRSNTEIALRYVSAVYGLPIEAVAENLSDYSEVFRAEDFNEIENAIEVIGRYITDYEVGFKKTFYPNGMFITYMELNRIEKILAYLEDDITKWLNSLYSLPMVLGRDRDFR